MSPITLIQTGDLVQFFFDSGPVLTSIVVTPSTATVTSGATQQFTAVGYDQFSAVFPISPVWSVGGALATITVTPNPSSVASGATQQYTAVGYDALGVVVPIPSGVWTTTNGTISATGLLTSGGVASGQTVTITSGAITGTSALTVTGTGPVTITVFSNASDREINSINAVYLTSRAGSGLTLAASETIAGVAVAFLTPDYVCQEAMLAFDTSVIPDDATVTAAVLHGAGIGTVSGTAWTLEARLHDWGATIETSDYVPGADLAAKTLLATRAVSAGWTTSYNVFTSAAGMAGAINKTGFTRMVVAMDSLRATTFPAGGDDVGNLLLAGSTLPAKLVITYTPVGGPLASITVTPSPSSVVTGATQQYTAVGYDSNGNIVTIPTPVWTTTNGTITSGGLLTSGAVATGQTVTITSGSITGTAALTVTASPVTITVYSDATDRGVYSTNAVYLTSRAGSNLVLDASETVSGIAWSFSSPDFVCQEAMIAFDTSSIPDTATITAAVLHGRGIGVTDGTAWIMEARLHDWGTTVTTADYVPGADLAAKTLLATRAVSAGWSTTAYNAFTSATGMLGAINKTGFTRMVLTMDGLRSTVAPTGTGDSCNIVLAGGTDVVKLVITYTP